MYVTLYCIVRQWVAEVILAPVVASAIIHWWFFDAELSDESEVTGV